MKTLKYCALIEQFWKHSVASAYAAEITSALLKLKLAADPFFMGLLHDVGKLALLQIFAAIEEKGKLKGDASGRNLIGTISEHHCQFGARLLKKWGYSEGYVLSALYHEDLNSSKSSETDDAAKASKELLIVNFANKVAKSIGFALKPSDEKDVDLAHIESAELLSLTSEQISKTAETVIKEVEAVSELF